MKNAITPVLALAALCSSAGYAQPAAVAPKAYVIAEITVQDPTAYEQYKAIIKPIVEKYGGKYLVRAGRVEAIDGTPPTGRVILLEFPSFAMAEAFEKSPENLSAATIRHKAATSRLFIVEGAQ
jgi:uncharacterized protein (DUF1330 family)